VPGTQGILMTAPRNGSQMATQKGEVNSAGCFKRMFTYTNLTNVRFRYWILQATGSQHFKTKLIFYHRLAGCRIYSKLKANKFTYNMVLTHFICYFINYSLKTKYLIWTETVFLLYRAMQ
jgi:hypothetical protein